MQWNELAQDIGVIGIVFTYRQMWLAAWFCHWSEMD
jgi:hypothetical protein